jgi:hypothetical protein
LVCRRLDLLDKSSGIVSQQYFICSDHFIDSQFVDESKQRLSTGAVPTVFDLNKQDALPEEVTDGDQIVVEGEYVCMYVCILCVYMHTCTCMPLMCDL